MKTGYFFKIAAGNIKKNTRLYIPRILAEAGLLGCFYILLTLAFDKRLDDALGGSYLSMFMIMGAVVIGLLSFVLILYINRFLMKQRKNEYGLYNVLGMEKRHITKVLFHESLISSVISVILGTVFGILFYKLSSLLICRILQGEIVAGFYYINLKTILLPAIIFMALDFFAYIIGSIGVRRLKPVELLAGKHTGEKEPRIKWVLLLLGVACLGVGYYISITTKSPLQAMALFFVAVLLVILGTYFLFIAGTTFVLKCLKNNKRYYYDKKHMPAVSGLLFRMKHNAVGLASIALLATGVLVMISTTVSLYSGIDDTLKAHYPKQFYLYVSQVKDDGKVITVPADELEIYVRESAKNHGLEIKSVEKEKMLTVSYLMRDGKLLTKTEVYGGYKMEELTNVVYITEETYSQIKSGKVTPDPVVLNLKSDEVAYCRIISIAGDFRAAPKTLTINGKVYKVKKEIEYFPVNSTTGEMVNTIGIVVSGDEVLDEIYLTQKEAYGEFASELADRIEVEFADEKAAEAVSKEFNREIIDKIKADYPGEIGYNVDVKWESRKNMLDLYGTFLFLGILLGFVCLFSTVLIIYYKQISEGYEDRERFRIMEKIGMEPKAVKKTIGSQIMLQLFLPLVTAAVHVAFAFPILLRLLKMLMLSNTALFIICSLITFAVFALVYTLVYFLTSKT
ncbi:MAG: ABC transporter permease [Clostridia bacterium]|nr:ABC transporter permease [Clostridia bacterium]